MVSYSRFIRITNPSDHNRIWTANCLHQTWWPSGLGNYFVRNRFAVQILLWSLEFTIQINLEHGTITVWNVARSWSISIHNCQLKLETFTICLCNSRKISMYQKNAVKKNMLIYYWLEKKGKSTMFLTKVLIQ